MRIKFMKKFNNSKKILITGGAGFIGGTLLRRLLEETECSIFILDKLGYASDENLIKNILNSNNERVSFFEVDLVNKTNTKNAIERSDPDFIFHLAAETHVDRSINDPTEFIYNNIIGTYNLLEAAKNHWLGLNKARKSTFRFHHISTDEVFGSLELDNQKFNENTSYDPRSPYSASKASSDHLVRAWFHTYGLPIIVTNCSNNFGPRQFPEKLIPLAIDKALKKERIPLYGDGSNVRDWLFVEDHVDGIISAALNGIPGKTYCIGGDCEKTNLELVNIICNQLDDLIPQNKPHSSLINFVKDRPGHDYRYSINSNLIQKDLGWSPKTNIEVGINKTINWYIKNIDWCKKMLFNSGYEGQRLGLK